MASPFSPSSSEKDHFEDSSSHSGSTIVDSPTASSQTIELDNLRVTKPMAQEKVQPPKSDRSEEDIEAAFQKLPSHEADILKAQILTPQLSHGIGVLYRCASRNDLIIIAIATIFSCANGAALPLMTIVFGGLQQTFSKFSAGLIGEHELTKKLDDFVLYFVYLAIGMFVVTYIATVGFIHTGERITAKIRQKYLESCLRQNIGYFDKVGTGEMVTRITSDTNLIQDGISEKVSVTISAIATFVTAFIIAFANYWKLTLILCCIFVAITLNSSAYSGTIIRNTSKSIEAQAASGSLADEVLGSIRNAVAFGTQDRLAKRYDQHLKKADYYGFKVKAAVGLMVGSMMMILYLSYALAFWQGTAFLLRNEMTLNQVLVVAMSVIMGAFNIGGISPNFQAFTTAAGAASKIFDTIDRVSPIDASLEQGRIIENLRGNIRLENIKHIYPSRPNVVIMNNVSLNIPAGKMTALVGPSGSGKSTIIGLLERFYNPVQGTVYLDGHDISTLNIRWLRSQIALVSQEPTLFKTSIFNNIRHGLVGSQFSRLSDEAQRDLVVTAAKKANAHDFICALPEGYETNVGDRGFLLSGGQKQRIAIARAIVSDPKILLLDEATSALDTKSEEVVQRALEAASEGRTTISIAHRLSTIKDAHNIVVMSAGKIIEQGTHNQLLQNQSVYFDLVSAQSLESDDSKAEQEEEAVEMGRRISLLRSSQIMKAGFDYNESTKEGEKEPMSSVAEIMALQDLNREEVPTYTTWQLIKFISSFNRSEWKRMLFGLICSVVAGFGNPISSIIFAKLIIVLTQELVPNADRDSIRTDGYFWSGMFAVLAIIILICYSGQGITFASCSEHLVRRLRLHAFRCMLRQDIAFFDKDENSTGALTSFLATETNNVAGLSGATLGTILMTLSTLISAVVLAVIVAWKLALVCMATIPVLLACGFFRFYVMQQFQDRAKGAYAQSASYASEALSAIRTVAALTREKEILAQYKKSVTAQEKEGFIATMKSSAVYSASQGGLFLCFGLAYWYGGVLLAKREYDIYTFFVCYMAVIYGAQSAGQIFAYAPDMGKAYNAARELKILSDRQPKVDTWSNAGERFNKAHVQGAVEFRDVHFRYPTRLEQPVLRGLNISIRPGQYVALVGASGCGKSTTIGLLERFYDPISGGIYVDGNDISALNVNEYRSAIALVSQEPTLYQGTIKENILLGSLAADVSDYEVEKACKEANIYDFIISLPDGFNTVVGSKGGLLSGGQKQRIAIARALIRNPRILLLDEATSALDSESEHIVQAALDKAAKGRTTIAIAHRLSTIQKADVIYVFDKGRVVESGSHQELMKANGRYADLVSLQSLGSS